MLEKIRKRDGRIVDFDVSKINSAILKAGIATGELDKNEARNLSIKVLALIEKFYKDDIPEVEIVQDIVEEVLITSPYKKTAKAYIIYREQHSKIREIIAKSDVDLVDSYLSKSDWQVKENSNMTYSLQGLNNYLSSEISKTYWLNKIYPPEIRKAHTNGDFHLHDLNQISVYCVGWDLQDLLQSGFKGVSCKIESKPPKHFRSALGQIVNFFYTLQGEAAGAQAFSSFDTLLAPYIRFDKLDYNEVKQALQEFVFNVNVPTRVGFQTPFTNVTLDLLPPTTLKDQEVIIGETNTGLTYGDFQEEMNIFNKAFVNVMKEGDAKGRVFTFPIPTYNITKDFQWDNPMLDDLWESVAKYGIPYFSNFINSDLSPEDARSMCCRLRLDTRELQSRGGGLFGANPLTGSIGVVTLNLPRAAYKSANEYEYFKSIENLVSLASESLEIKRKVLEQLTHNMLYPYTAFYLRSIKERFGNYWQNHFSTIGVIGMNEAIMNLYGKEYDITSDKGKKLASKTLDFIRERLVELQNRTGNYYNLEATPAEGTSYRLAILDKKIFPEIITSSGLESKEHFYTNSTQLPINYSDDLFEVLEHQDELQTKYTGGTVVHLFSGEKNITGNSVRKLVRKICENFTLPYFTITPTFSICPNDGYIAGEVHECPICSSKCEVFSRVVGYIRPISQWNNGKAAEFELRKTFKIQTSDIEPQFCEYV
ncbi:MAG: ribonucleoside triphosphate reductase [Candidatus Delongbacteria bacterium]|nr:ribonucleoside triphosphate reductase [Candidatus Delongbacteria bacterium]MBN2836327.1 ribonucleoside triphosphate reductase [Candidatus Delongbacteria bacterium]